MREKEQMTNLQKIYKLGKEMKLIFRLCVVHLTFLNILYLSAKIALDGMEILKN